MIRRSLVKASPSYRLLVTIAIVSIGFVPVSHAQNLKRYPTDEYYTSLSLLRDGQLAEAQHGFETALRKARHEGDDYGIDGVPSVIRIGEALCVQGMLDAGLNLIEEGLAVSNRARRWTDYLKANPMAYRGLAKETRGLQWHTTTRDGQLGEFPDHWPVAIGAPGTLVEIKAAQAAEAVRLDALSIYTAQARGLWLRQRLLGPIAKDLPLSSEILEAFPPLRADFPEVLQRSQMICRGLALIALEQTVEAERMIRENLEVQGGWEHPLTGIGLLALSDLAVRQGDPKTAYTSAADASLIFARLSQFEWLMDASEAMATTDALAYKRSSLPALEEMGSWLRSRSYPAYSSCLADQALVALDFDNVVAGESAAAQALRPLSKTLGPTIRVQASARLAQSRVHFKRGELNEGLQSIETAMDLLRGNEETGPGTRHGLQMHRLRSMLNAKQIAPEIAYRWLDRLLDGPSEKDWQNSPLESLTVTTDDWDGFSEMLLESVRAANDPTKLVEFFDRIQGIRQRYRLPLAARDLDLRLLFHGPPGAKTAISEAERNAVRKALPSIDQAADEIELLIRKARSVAAVDSKSWTVEERQVWSRLETQCDKQEAGLYDACLQRLAFPTIFPTRKTLASLPTGARVLGFFQSLDLLYGYLLADGKPVELWTISKSDEARRLHFDLTKQLALDASPTSVAAALNDTAWKETARRLRQVLIPDSAWKIAAGSKTLTIVPDDWLWYVPFEMLPMEVAEPERPLITGCAVRYACFWGQAVESKPPIAERSLVVSQPDYFTPDRDLNQSLLKEWTAVDRRVQLLDSKAKVHSGRWSRLQFDRVVVAVDNRLQLGVPFAPMAYDVGGETSLRQWLRLPLRAPSEMILLGSDMTTGRTATGHGVEVSRLVFCMAAAGNRTLLIGRRPSRGESSRLLVDSFIEAAQVLSPAEAWRRAVLTLWETRLSESNEPVLVSPRKDREVGFENLTGLHPVFWSNMMVVEN